MRSRPFPSIALALSVAALVAAAGCVGMRSGSGTGRAAGNPEASDLSRALAHYSAALRDEWNDDPASAFTNFQAAARLDPDNEDLQFRVAVGLLQQEQPAAALDVMEALVKRRPKSGLAQLRLAFIAQLASREDRALEAYSRAMKLVPSDDTAPIQKAMLLTKLERFDDAIETLEDSLGGLTNPPPALKTLGEIVLLQTRTPGAKPLAPREIDSLLARFNAAVTNDPKDGHLLLFVAELNLLTTNLAPAVAALERLEEIRPDDLRLRQRAATLLGERVENAPLIRGLEQLAQDQPENPHLLYYLATARERTKDLAAAEADYVRILDLDPKDAASYLRLAVLLTRRDAVDDAADLLLRALKNLPDDPRFLELLAYLEIGRKRYEEAAAYFDETRRVLQDRGLAPMAPRFALSHALALQLSGDIDGAARVLQRTLGREPGSLDLYIQFVFREDQGSDFTSTTAVLETLASRMDDDPDILYYLGLFHSYGKRFQESVDAFEKARRRAIETENDEILGSAFYYWYAAAADRNGEFDRAVELLKTAIGFTPDPAETQDFRARVDALNYLAYIWAERGIELDQGETMILEALEADPDNPAFIDTLGWIYFMQGRTEDAEREIARALKLLPEDATITDHMGDIQLKLGRPEEAIRWWSESFVLDPRNAKVQQKLEEKGIDVETLRQRAEAAARTIESTPETGSILEESLAEPDSEAWFEPDEDPETDETP